MPLDLRYKKTRAIRRRLTKHEVNLVTEKQHKKDIHFPLRSTSRLSRPVAISVFADHDAIICSDRVRSQGLRRSHLHKREGTVGVVEDGDVPLESAIFQPLFISSLIAPAHWSLGKRCRSRVGQSLWEHADRSFCNRYIRSGACE
jgi:hypothetical protein